MSAPVLETRALNRALLQRQGLLERTAAPVLDTIEHLAGMQAQVPENPYTALWSRLTRFRPAELSDLIAGRLAVRSQLMRATIHLVAAQDARTFHPVTRDVLARTFKSPWAAGLGDARLKDVVAAGRAALQDGPLTRAQLGALLADRWPRADPAALGHAVTFHLPLVQVPPRGMWGRSGQATWATVESWLDAPLDPEPGVDGLMLRYLAAFGPATVADMRTWSGLTGLGPVVERLRPGLRTFRDERGRELLDVPGGALPDPRTPAPPRFLPEFDNVALSHHDRSRIISEHVAGLPFARGRWIGTVMVDGFCRATWRMEEQKGLATLSITGRVPLPGDPRGTRRAVVAEGERLAAFLLPDAEHRITLDPPA